MRRDHNGKYPDYKWGGPFSDEEEDQNGDVWTPEDAYHKHECVAVLGRGENAESQLYEWLQWFDREGFKVTHYIDANVSDPVRLILGKQHVVRIERKGSF